LILRVFTGRFCYNFGMIEAPDIDLSTIPIAQRAVVTALMETIAVLREITRRQQHLIAEMNHALHGKRSEKLAEDARQLSFEDLSIALGEVEAQKEYLAAKTGDTVATKPAPKRTIGNLPAALPRFEEVIEPDSLDCPCGCGVAIVARTNGATIATAQNRRRPHRAAGHRSRAVARDCHRAPEIRLPDLHRRGDPSACTRPSDHGRPANRRGACPYSGQ
jgi:hypothetical protein